MRTLLCLVAGVVGSLSLHAHARAQILVYNFNDCSKGTAVQTTSTGTGNLAEFNRLPDGSQSSAKCWSADGAGLTGKPGDYALDFSSATAMGATGKGGVAIVRDADSVLAGLKSFTLCGWFKVTEPADGGARFFDMIDQDGNGLILLFGGKQVSLQVNKHGWTCKELDFSEVNTWVFVAVSYNSTQSSDNLVFYKGIRGKPLQSSRLDAAEVTDLSALSHAGLAMGNNPGFQRPLKGLLDDMAVYGSSTDGTGALDEAAVKKIFQANLSGTDAKATR